MKKKKKNHSKYKTMFISIMGYNIVAMVINYFLFNYPC